MVSRSWPMKLGGSLVRGTPGRAGAASDDVRDGLGLSDGPGPASSDGKAYVRNRCLTLGKSSAGSNLTDMGRCAVRGWFVSAGWPTPKPVAVVRWGGHGECLRRSRGEAVGVKVGASLINRFLVNVGTIRGRLPPGIQSVGGQVRCRLEAVGWGGGLVVVRARESRVHGEGGQQVSS